ncbi:MAG TPA: LamG domain-containing protein, partial [Candidatus Marinimicrobia bacterium]|nr:LamG domain-containing protein [Candidatus Neomarinimicrobiota bacterium]
DEDGEVPDVTFHGNDAESETDLGGEEFQAIYTLSGIEPEGDVEFSILVTDYVGNQNTYTGTTDGSTVVYDKTPPELNSVTIVSDNIYDTTWAKVNDTISITFTPNEEISADFVLSFDGVDDYVGTGTSLLNNLSEFSMAGWINPSSYGNREGFFGQNDLIEFGFNGSSISLWTLRTGWLNWGFNDMTFPLNTYHYIVIVGTTSSMKLYVDGELKTEQSFSISDYGSNGYPFNIAGGGIFDPSGNWYHGLMDEVSVWNTALSQSEVQLLMNSNLTGNESGLIGYWNFNEGSGNVAYDQSNNNHDGILNNMDLTSAWFYRRGSGPSISIMNDDAIISIINTDQFYSEHVTTSTDPEGEVEFEITFTDLAGNQGELVNSTTNGSRVIFDMTEPTDFTVGSVLSTGGNVVENAWNSTNTGLDVTVPVESDTTLKNGWIQVWTKVGNNAFEKLGDSTTIANSDVGTDKVISFTSEQVEAITGFAEEDTLTVKAIMSDRPGNETEGSESINQLVIDQVLPNVVNSHIESDNADSTKAKVDDNVTITFQVDELIQSPTMTISGGSGTVTDLGSFNWSGTYTMQETDDEGVVSFTVDEIIDVRGNPADGFTSTSDESQVVYDRTKPELNSVQLATNNSWNQYWAKENDYGRIYTNSSEDLLTLACTFNGNVTTDHWYSAHEFDLGYTFSSTDTDGLVVYEIAFVDSAGNLGDTVRASTNNTFIVFDKTPPANFTVGDVSATGGNAVATFWNSTNTGLDVIVPIENDSTLDSGRVQIWAKVGANDFEMLGDSSFILSSEVGSTKTMSIPGDSVRAITGFTENDTITVKAFMFDIPGNETDGTESTTTLLIDETPPSLISASYESNFSDSSLATVGHVVTLTFETDVEIQTPSATISTQNAIISDLGSNRWSASYEMQEGDTEGVIPFQIDTLTDSRGNPTEGSSTTTDGTEVTFDNTQPTINPVTILSNNPDTEWAKVGDTVTVTFTGEETLTSQTATIVTQSATIADLGGQVYTAKYKMTESDPEGEVTFEIIVTDQVELESDPVTGTTDESLVIFDRTAPTLDLVHIESNNENNTLIAIGGN